MQTKFALRVIDISTELTLIQTIKTFKKALKEGLPLERFEELVESIEIRLRNSGQPFPEVFISKAQNKIIDYLLEQHIDLSYLRLPKANIEHSDLEAELPSDIEAAWKIDFAMVKTVLKTEDPEEMIEKLLSETISNMMNVMEQAFSFRIDKATKELLKVTLHAGMIIYIQDKFNLEHDHKPKINSALDEIEGLAENLKSLAEQEFDSLTGGAL